MVMTKLLALNIGIMVIATVYRSVQTCKFLYDDLFPKLKILAQNSINSFKLEALRQTRRKNFRFRQVKKRNLSKISRFYKPGID